METWFWALVCFFRILTMIVNGFVIAFVCSQRQLRTKTNAYVVS